MNFVRPLLEGEDEEGLLGEEGDVDGKSPLLRDKLRRTAVSHERLDSNQVSEEGDLLDLLQELFFANRPVHSGEEKFVAVALEDGLHGGVIRIALPGWASRNQRAILVFVIQHIAESFALCGAEKNELESV